MNNIYSELRKSAFKVYILGGSFMLLLGVLITYATCSHLFKYFFVKAPDLFETPSSEFADGKWFTCDNNILFGYYASDNSGRYYLTNTNDGEYFGFFVYNNNNEKADRISEDTFDYLEEKTDSLSTEFLSGKGYMVKMDSSEERFFKEYFSGTDYDLEDYDLEFYTFRLVTPWKLITDDNGNENTFYFFIGLILTIIGLVSIIIFICGGYKSGFKNAMKKYNISYDVLDQDMYSSEKIANAYVGNQHVVFYTTPGATIMPYNALVWIYVMITTTKHTTYGIPTGTSKSYQLTMWNKNKEKVAVTIKDENIGHQIIEAIINKAPYFYVGYSKELAEATENGKFSNMIQAVNQKRAEWLQQMSNANNMYPNNTYPNNMNQGSIDPYTMYPNDSYTNNSYQNNMNQSSLNPNNTYPNNSYQNNMNQGNEDPNNIYPNDSYPN